MATNKRLIKSNDEGGGVVPTSFNTVLYTGNSTNDFSTALTQSVTGVGFEPDFVWIKNRNSTYPHGLFDNVRGATKLLQSMSTGAEIQSDGYLKSFDTDGFGLGGDYAFNRSGYTYVAWCWKAGGAAVTNTDGTITSQVSANTEAGFSVVSYTGNLTASTVGHGLSNTPSIYIVKRRDSISNWFVYNENIGNTKYLNLDSTNAAATFNVWNNTSPTNSVFSLAGQGDVNASGGNYIAYCFAEVAGFSKFGSYTGTGAGVQNTINCGFAPRFVMIKRTNSTGGWRMYDNVRGLDRSIQAQSSDAEYDDTTNYLDFYSNGFEFNNGVSYQSNPDINASGGEYIYMAFANQF